MPISRPGYQAGRPVAWYGITYYTLKVSEITYYEFVLTESYAAAARGIILTQDEKKELANLRKVLKGK